ncbi:MAG TPA: hypothetical protein VF547_03080, partial [Allosphingosinicella sp.]
IYNFQTGIDKVDLSRIDSNVFLEGDQAFTFRTGEFSGQGAASAGEVRVITSIPGSFYALEADVNGDGSADLYILFDHAVDLSPADIIY